jgi:predicted small integral membrane protein
MKNSQQQGPLSNRAIKIAFSLMVGAYFSVVVFNNTTDYNTNFEFVCKVTSMQDVFSAPTNNWRGIENHTLHHIFYASIIAVEATIAFLMFLGAYRMTKALRSDSNAFAASKHFTTLGLSLGIVLFFFLFLTIGGEWYLMWQSHKWNAQGNAFSLTICFMLFLLFHNQPNE